MATILQLEKNIWSICFVFGFSSVYNMSESASQSLRILITFFTSSYSDRLFKSESFLSDKTYLALLLPSILEGKDQGQKDKINSLQSFTKRNDQKTSYCWILYPFNFWMIHLAYDVVIVSLLETTKYLFDREYYITAEINQ